MTPTPLVPRITKSTAVAAIRARFENDGDLLERFEIAKEQANLWDGERDGLREAVKVIQPGQFMSSANNNVVLSRTETAKVLYPNSAGKHQLENCLQTTIPAPTGYEPGDAIFAIMGAYASASQFLDHILSMVAKYGKDEALDHLEGTWVGCGQFVDNAELYEKKGSEKSSIVVLPCA
jgi:hypothetical protein